MKTAKLALSLLLAASGAMSMAAVEPVKVTVEKVKIPTYTPAPLEDLPMFAEYRHHQRSTGNPFPNKVWIECRRDERVDTEYTMITLENEYIKVEILPEIGGKVYSALDKTNGYDFFYKNHVMKPALIGCYGLWTSGGIEFNWPFHHRASGYMPSDFEVEYTPEGGAIVWMSEHDPTDRMTGTVGIALNPGESIFETKMHLSNITPMRHSFLWWENAAVPVNENYRIFYPHDVNHVVYHNRLSVTTWPIASTAAGCYNGIKYEGPTDISLHGNTRMATSYFSAASDFDFFGGYDHGLRAGVVHVGDHHVSPGKKCWSWAYSDLAKIWENALTDSDGAYCELMAGSYTNNQPDFTWLEPGETKSFSQYWFPIGEIGVPDFADKAGAIYAKDNVKVQLTRAANVDIVITDAEGKELYRGSADLQPRKEFTLPSNVTLPKGATITVTEKGETRPMLAFTSRDYDKFTVPHNREEMPNVAVEDNPYQLYLEGVHVDQYRHPSIKGEAYYAEALKRDPSYAPAMIALAETKYNNYFLEEALELLEKAEGVITQYNSRPESGRLFYNLGLVHKAMGNTDTAYDYFRKAAWAADHVSSAMTEAAMIDIKRGHYPEAIEHLNTALTANADNKNAQAMLITAYMLNGEKDAAKKAFDNAQEAIRLNHLARWEGVMAGFMTEKEFFAPIMSDRNQLAIDLVDNLLAAGLDKHAVKLIEAVKKNTGLNYSLASIYGDLTGKAIPAKATEGIAFPSRIIEIQSLEGRADKDPMAAFQLGCALYGKGHWQAAADLWAPIADKDYRAARNMAVANYSHLGKRDEVLPYLKKALELKPGNRQLIYETVYVMGKLGVDPAEQVAFIEANEDAIKRDDIAIEYARTLNMAGRYDDALNHLNNHSFTVSEGSEHYVADQYMTALMLKAREMMNEGKYAEAADLFHQAQSLPENLGSAVWNIVKWVPAWYGEAVCRTQLGQNDVAKECYDKILNIDIDYFSDLYFPELPIYHALAMRDLGNPYDADMLVNYKIQDWKKGLKAADAGYFGGTPFFISYCDSPAEQRAAHFNYLLGLAYQYTGDEARANEYLQAAADADPYGIAIYSARVK